uniref:Uncharacterized protein n=1 Tax=Dunaliella tertiolecta TaxID=3047 RepID=A0A6S8N2B1_DUNTE|mmetsp:Transcript_11227/g.30614  ORF Transcript_11227/g.30614 Transcript_11227/m.30614 type:complete len:127 (+) Transcript_11227:100-480(+)|eukprot:CAMPEP_0202377908 /NCGR_PEP_ID=MMETSP1127-20130417/14515_1 /ASSEMBLY_ACC=CAM_ASM_000462 /TAXON_ID=3047 /ORGANISM="Dunaliella tertiolecta, Strain CCMP1320" /LENGTH=126 /DNA_ID=CAMNT_0048976069 /DNA_START=75 /DNA_END=455 /DNA_ORIENTATION=+
MISLTQRASSGSVAARSRCHRPARIHPLRAPHHTQRPVQPARAIELDFSDPDTQLAIAGVLLGLVAGIGAPLWYINRTERDEERLEELRAMNRANYSQTGEYMTEEEIAAIRKPKWTDRREFVDDD